MSDNCHLRFPSWVIESTHVEVLGVNVAMLGKVEVLLGHEHTLCSIRRTKSVRVRRKLSEPIALRKPHIGVDVNIPRKRYSWIFLRSSLGISLR